MGDKMKPLWIEKFIVVDSLGKGHLKLQITETGKKLANTYRASNVKLRPKYAEGPEETIYEEETAGDEVISQMPETTRCEVQSYRSSREREPRYSCSIGLKAVYLTSSQELTQPRRIHKIRGDGNYYFRAISLFLTGVINNRPVVRDRVVRHMECAAIGSKLEGYLNKNVTDYLNSSSMDRDGVWAMDAEIISTANLPGCGINVYCKWQRFNSQFTLSQSTDACL